MQVHVGIYHFGMSFIELGEGMNKEHAVHVS